MSPEGASQSQEEERLRLENDELRAELQRLRLRLQEPEDIVRALRRGEVDALVLTEPQGDRIHTLRSADGLYRRMIENMKEGAVVLDRAGVVVYCNACFAELIDVERTVILGKSILPSIPAEGRSFFEPLHSSQPGPWRQELTLRTKDGMVVPVFATMNRIQVEEHDVFCLILTDLTGQKREQELMVEGRRKDEFLAMLAHELRNPIAPIRNAAYMLTMTASPEPKVNKAREIIDRQVTHMTRLVDDLLDVSRITRGKIRLDSLPTDLALVISRGIEIARPLIESRGHDLTVDLPSAPLPVLADMTRLSQAISNLLNNAAKFTGDGGKITLKVDRQDAWLVISVRDTGIGIASEMLPQVFDLFTQADSTRGRAQGGLGIGLTLVRRLVEMHGGTVEANSAGLGRGSEFIVRLPVLGGAPAYQPDTRFGELPPPRPRRATVPRRILVVDDNADSSESLMMMLVEWGHDVRAVGDAESALEEARTFRPQMMLVDIGLPGMNGYDLARALRSTPGLEGVVLVAVTGYGCDEDRRASMEAGFNHHWVKPIDPRALSTFTSVPPGSS